MFALHHLQENPVNPTWPRHFQPEVVRSGYGSGKLSSYCIALEAWRRGLEVTFTHPQANFFEVSDGNRVMRYDHSRPSEITAEAQTVVDNKYRTSELLREAGVPVPDSQLFNLHTSTFEQIREHADDFGYPVVLKPLRGSRGQGVFANITSEPELHSAYEHLRRTHKSRQVVLEKHQQGNDFRAYVVGDQLVAACQRIPANVTGDGVSTVQDLIRRKNKDRRNNPFLSRGLIKADYEIESYLKSRGYNYETVPGVNEYLPLRQKANASAGGDVIDVTNALPSTIRDAAVQAVRAIPGLPSGGVDILWDPSSPDPTNAFAIIEINSRAHIGVNMYPTQGAGQDVPQAILDAAFPESPRPRSEHFAPISFDLNEVLSPLRNGIADRIRLKPLPRHGLPARKIYTLKNIGEIRRNQRYQLHVAARRASISGHLDLHSDSGKILLCGKEGDIQNFLDAAELLIGEEAQEVRHYHGPVTFGFFIRDRRETNQ